MKEMKERGAMGNQINIDEESVRICMCALSIDRVCSERFPSGCTNHRRIRPNIYFQKQLYMFHWGFDWTPGGHVVDRCLDDLMFEVMLILDGVPGSSKSAPPASHLFFFVYSAQIFVSQAGRARRAFIFHVCFVSH